MRLFSNGHWQSRRRYGRRCDLLEVDGQDTEEEDLDSGTDAYLKVKKKINYCEMMHGDDVVFEEDGLKKTMRHVRVLVTLDS
jgi:hypothetical protein